MLNKEELMLAISDLYKKYKEQLLYLIFGGLTTVINIALYWLLGLVDAPVTVKYSIAWLGSVIFAYLTNRVWVFESGAHSVTELWHEFVAFCLARIATGVIGYVIVLFGVYVLQQNDFIWNILSQVFVIVSNYALSKLVIFKKNEGVNDDH
ncbi:GtrA family protein [Weissella halotolerans]|uniref:GtcA family membrane protein n=2 Tax=Weissella halotolerans TaxID=1615 RepID=A0A0R2FS62_9LACO|nr:GtrA family protein [Weissella halotolerans]KRN31305.1 GtcA family membrane protein [Weissella halotolerans DSM 20190]